MKVLNVGFNFILPNMSLALEPAQSAVLCQIELKLEYQGIETWFNLNLSNLGSVFGPNLIGCTTARLEYFLPSLTFTCMANKTNLKFCLAFTS